MDTDLDFLGKAQAAALATYFATKELTTVFSSDLQRCIETAFPTAHQKAIPITKTELLRERSLGELENAPISDLRKAFEDEIERTGESRYKVRPRGVESAYDVMARVDKFKTLISVSQGDVVVFTHGMTQECLLCNLIGAPVESSRSFSFDNASITQLKWDRDVWVLEQYNSIEHLRHIDRA